MLSYFPLFSWRTCRSFLKSLLWKFPIFLQKWSWYSSHNTLKITHKFIHFIHEKFFQILYVKIKIIQMTHFRKIDDQNLGSFKVWIIIERGMMGLILCILMRTKNTLHINDVRWTYRKLWDIIPIHSWEFARLAGCNWKQNLLIIPH